MVNLVFKRLDIHFGVQALGASTVSAEVEVNDEHDGEEKCQHRELGLGQKRTCGGGEG